MEKEICNSCSPVFLQQQQQQHSHLLLLMHSKLYRFIWSVCFRSKPVHMLLRPTTGGMHPRRCVLLCGRQQQWGADVKSIVMDQSAAWLEPCGVRVRGNNSDFLHLLPSSHYPLLLSSSLHLQIPTPLSSATLGGILCVRARVCVCVRVHEGTKTKRGYLMLWVMGASASRWEDKM